jgi:hypothetical protein
MINPVFVPMESLEAEEDNEPPSLEMRHDLIARPCPGMDSPSFGLTGKPKFFRHNPFYSSTGFFRDSQPGRCFCLPLHGPAGKVLMFFPWSPFSGPPQS